MSIESLKQTFDLKFQFLHFPLHPETPDEGIELSRLFPNRDRRRQGCWQSLTSLMEEAGLPYGKRERTYNSRLAQEFAAWGDAETSSVDLIHDALFAAYFVDNRNIGSMGALIEIAQDLSLDDKRAEEVLKHRLYSLKVNEDWQRAWATGELACLPLQQRTVRLWSSSSPEPVYQAPRND